MDEDDRPWPWQIGRRSRTIQRCFPVSNLEVRHCFWCLEWALFLKCRLIAPKRQRIYCIRELWFRHDLTTVDLQKSASSTFEDRRARAKRSDGISKIDPTLEQRPQTLAGGHQLSNVSYMLLQGPQYPILFAYFGFHPSFFRTPIFNYRSNGLNMLFTINFYLPQVCRYQWNLSIHSNRLHQNTPRTNDRQGLVGKVIGPGTNLHLSIISNFFVGPHLSLWWVSTKSVKKWFMGVAKSHYTFDFFFLPWWLIKEPLICD